MRILCTLDGSKESLAVLSALEAFKSTPELSVELLGVVNTEDEGVYDHSKLDAVTATGPGAIFRSSESPLWHEAARAREGAAAQEVLRRKSEATTFLSKAAAALADAGIPSTLRVEVDNDPTEAIVRVAREENPDIIAMATHARSGLRSLFGDSVALDVVRSEVAPVLLVQRHAS